ncbi:MAG: NAD(P)H-hydrate epimerase, partial [Rhodoferax sp.]
MSTSFRRILSGHGSVGLTSEVPVYTVDAIKGLEFELSEELGNNVLMQRAGLALAQFSLAISPHARSIWIPVGAGNNAGDGFEAAMHLRLWGKEPIVTMVNSDAKWSPETAASLQNAIEAGVNFSHLGDHEIDLCIDAVFGTGL